MLTVVLLGPVIAVLGVALLTVAVYLVASARNRVPPVFTPPVVMKQVVTALDLPERGRLVDLGCGDGRVLEAVSKARPDISALGVENNPVIVMLARIRLRGRARVRMGQIEEVNFFDVDRVFAYLGPELMAWLEPRFERELPQGARVVSQQFPLPHRQPDRVVELAQGKPFAKTLYVYKY